MAHSVGLTDRRTLQERVADGIVTQQDAQEWLRSFSDQAEKDAKMGAAKSLRDAIATRVSTSTPKTLAEYGNAELVMEMIGRGYAVMKLPEAGGPPETLR